MASPVVYFVRRGHLPISRFLLFASVALGACRSPAPALTSTQQQSPQRVSQAQIIARIPGVAIRLPAKGGTPQLYRLPRLTPVDGVLRGRLPPVERVVGLGPDGTLYAIDDQRHVVSLSRRTRFAWPQALTAMPRDLFGSTDQRLVGVI